jgi:hypothetical protein
LRLCRRGNALMGELDLDGHDFQTALRSLAAEQAHAQQQDQNEAMQDGGDGKTRGALAALPLAWTGRIDPQGLVAAKVHEPILT